VHAYAWRNVLGEVDGPTLSANAGVDPKRSLNVLTRVLHLHQRSENPRWEVIINTSESVLAALDIEARYKASFWVALFGQFKQVAKDSDSGSFAPGGLLVLSEAVFGLVRSGVQ